MMKAQSPTTTAIDDSTYVSETSIFYRIVIILWRHF